MRILRLILPGLGLLLLGFLVGKMGLDEILRSLALIRWNFALVLLVACMWHVTNTIAWSFAFADAFRPRLRALIMTKLAGDAVSQLTPLANMGGEPLKAYLLRNQAPTSRGLASVIINKTAQVMTGLLFTVVGLCLVVLNWNLPQAVPLPIQIGLTSLLLLAAGLIWLLYRKQRHLFSSLLALFRRLGLRMDLVESKMTRAVRIDSEISRFYHEHKVRFALVLLFHAAGWMLGALETYVILRALGEGVSFDVAILITSLAVIINSLFFFMPSNIGVLEGGQVFLFLTLGLNPALGLA
ncbi:MAG TPA: flippase-like domain-containing protein, partial [Candidatus Latescibacteria bacterium]|nr:flippase-like domain-containing protein [Candidatus Latescibacterota bacterium]